MTIIVCFFFAAHEAFGSSCSNLVLLFQLATIALFISAFCGSFSLLMAVQATQWLAVFKDSQEAWSLDDILLSQVRAILIGSRVSMP